MLKDKINNLFAKKEGESNKKKIENLVVFLIILIITIIVINVIWNGDKKKEDTESTDANKRLASQYNSGQDITKQNDTSANNYEKDSLSINLENILTKINGVGKVQVMITYSETSKIIPVYNEESTEENTEETDSEGGTRKVSQTDTKKEVIYEEKDGAKELITQSTTSPKIEGAIITAEGAGSAEVKTNIIQAVEAVTGLATHKIQVFQMTN